jgi:hypothetical protein
MTGNSRSWPRVVTASTLDPEASDHGSSPRAALCLRQLAANLRSPSSRQLRLEHDMSGWPIGPKLWPAPCCASQRAPRGPVAS